jgi:penicillin-binding protein 1A
VVQHGTGAAAAQLKHPLGGKTGTTSDFTDAWFLGFSPSVTCGVWVGYDSNQALGEKETGARAALPIWMTVMRIAIAGKDDERFPGDEQTGKPLRVAVVTPAKPVPPAAGTPAKPVKTVVGAKLPAPAAVSGPGTKPPANPPAKSLVQPVEAPPAAKPQVKPALPAEPAQAKPKAVLKPAVDAEPEKPENRQQK